MSQLLEAVILVGANETLDKTLNITPQKGDPKDKVNGGGGLKALAYSWGSSKLVNILK